MTVAGARERGQRRPSNAISAESAEAADEMAAQFQVGLGGGVGSLRLLKRFLN